MALGSQSQLFAFAWEASLWQTVIGLLKTEIPPGRGGKGIRAAVVIPANRPCLGVLGKYTMLWKN